MNSSDTRIGVPKVAAEISATWLTSALKAGGADLTVTDLMVEPIGVGVGIMSLVYRLTPTYEGTIGPKSFVVKIAPPWEQIRSIAAGYGFYNREVEIYRNLAPRLGLRPPTCYYGEFISDTDEFVVVIDDLGHLRSLDQLDGCPVDDARLIIESLARHHATWWGDPTLFELSYIQTAATPPWPQFNDQGFKQSWPVILERGGDLVPERVRAVGERWSDVGPVIMRKMANHKLTLIHGDVRLDNVFFHDDGGDPVSIIDWQIANIGIGTFDLAYFISQSMTVEDRREHLEDLLALYHATLVANGVSDYTIAEMWHDFRMCVLFCLTYPVLGGAGELANARALQLVRSMLERTVQTIIDTDADELIGSL